MGATRQLRPGTPNALSGAPPAAAASANEGGGTDLGPDVSGERWGPSLGTAGTGRTDGSALHRPRRGVRASAAGLAHDQPSEVAALHQRLWP